MEQKTVELLGLTVVNDKIIRLVELDFNKFRDSNVIEIIGGNGDGKSTFIDGAKAALSGLTEVKDKELLEKGLKWEAQISDGTHKLFMGFNQEVYCFFHVFPSTNQCLRSSKKCVSFICCYIFPTYFELFNSFL